MSPLLCRGPQPNLGWPCSPPCGLARSSALTPFLKIVFFYPEEALCIPQRGFLRPYSPECLEGEFCEVELPIYGVLRSWLPANHAQANPKQSILGLPLVPGACYVSNST